MFRTFPFVKPSRSLLAGLLGFCAVGLQAQSPAVQDEASSDAPKKQQVTQSTISRDEITLIKDMDQSPLEKRDPASILQSRVDAGQSKVQQSPNSEASNSGALDINKVRVIHPNNYNALSDERKAAIDADPYYVVSDLSRREIMAEFITGKRAVTSEPKPASKPAPAKPE
jgi:hypothetical protein